MIFPQTMTSKWTLMIIGCYAAVYIDLLISQIFLIFYGSLVNILTLLLHSIFKDSLEQWLIITKIFSMLLGILCLSLCVCLDRWVCFRFLSFLGCPWNVWSHGSILGYAVSHVLLGIFHFIWASFALKVELFNHFTISCCKFRPSLSNKLSTCQIKRPYPAIFRKCKVVILQMLIYLIK